MNKKKVFIIEDDKMIVEELKNIYLSHGFDVMSLERFVDDPYKIEIPDVDLIVLDLNLPGASGYEILSFLKENSSIPVLILTSRNKLDDELKSFDLGADEFLTKPILSSRLIARTNKLLSIYSKFSDQLRVKDLILETSTNKITYKNSFTILSQIESDLLEVLMNLSPKAVSKDDLLEAGWHTRYIDENILQVNINRLRKKLKLIGLNDAIETHRGYGYRLDVEKI